MNALRLLWDLRGRGARVIAQGGKVHCHLPPGVEVPDLPRLLGEAKPELLRLLGEPCPCASCREPGAEAHGPRCYCPACLDADPKWEALRAEIAEDDRYEAEERLAIQEEACTPAELEALRNVAGGDEGT